MASEEKIKWKTRDRSDRRIHLGAGTPVGLRIVIEEKKKGREERSGAERRRGAGSGNGTYTHIGQQTYDSEICAEIVLGGARMGAPADIHPRSPEGS